MDMIMNDLGNLPILLSVKPLITQFSNFEKLAITSRNFTIGRGLQNSLVIPFISISRNHCTFKNIQDKEWILEDNSSFGIEVNHQKLGKNISKKLNDGDIISFEPSGEFIYKFVCPSPDDYETPNKRIKREPKSPEGNNILDDVKIKFEESQSCEIRYIENKIQNAKDMKTASLILKGQLQLNMKKKIHQLEKEFATQIENLKGEKNDVEKQKALLIAERNIQLQVIKEEMQGKINELLNQIKKHNETESELLKENSLLKEKLTKEREEFLLELNRENTSKQDLLERLECKVREQEENFLIEKQELEKVLRKEVEQLRSTKEKELKDLVELKQQRETELREELDSMKKNLQEQLELTEQQKLQVQQDLNKQLETMKQLSNMENAKIEQLLKEREEIQKTLHEAQISAQKSLEELQERVSIRETELAALAADRIQKQSEQSCEVILNLQEQLEMVKNQLQSVENEKDSLLKNINATENLGEGTSKQTTLTRVGELIESELQCSICAELFVEATTLNCSHTFCKYCITMWKKKKKDCPICRAPITSECRSLVLDTFIDKMVQNLTEEMKVKRQDILKHRADCESELAQKNNARSRGRSDIDESDYDDSQEDYEGEEEEESNDEIYDSDHIFYWGTPSSDFESSDLDLDSSGASNEFSTTSRAAAGSIAPLGGPTGHNANSVGSRRGRYVEGTPGAYYGGYGHCFRCGARGHWATGCPYR